MKTLSSAAPAGVKTQNLPTRCTNYRLNPHDQLGRFYVYGKYKRSLRAPTKKKKKALVLIAVDIGGKNTGVGCHFLLQCVKVKSESEVTQSCPTLSEPMDCSPLGSSIHGIFQARVLEWAASAFSGIYPEETKIERKTCI